MGNYVSCRYGLGVFITSHKVHGEDVTLQEGCDSMSDYLDAHLNRDLCGYGTAYEYDAPREDYEFFVMIEDYKDHLFTDGGMKQKADELAKHLTELGLEFGSFGVVGGYQVY